MRLKLICVGKAKSAPEQLASVYIERIKGYGQLSVIEVAETRYVQSPGPGERDRVLAAEGARILAKLEAKDHVVALDERGREFTSEAFAAYLQEHALRGASTFAFVIGGSLGLSPEVKARADLCLSLSKFTLPHLLARVVLLEQLYRAFTILRGEPYHK